MCTPYCWWSTNSSKKCATTTPSKKSVSVDETLEGLSSWDLCLWQIRFFFTTGYRRVRSHGDVNPFFPQRRRYGTITGCRAFSPNLRAILWPERFQSANIEKFDGTQNHLEFLQIYTTAIRATRGGEHVMANYLSTMLKGFARLWLLN